MKKILILTQYFPPEMGAPQIRLMETALGLKERGWQVRIVSAMPNYPTGKIFPGYRGKFSVQEEVQGIPVYRYYLYPSNSKSSLPRIISMFSYSLTAFAATRMVKHFKPAFIYTESPPLTLGLTGLTLAKWSRAKHILNVSDLWPLSALELGAIKKGFIYKRLEVLERYLYKSSYACTGQSSQIVEAVKAKGARRAILFRNGVNSKSFLQATKFQNETGITGRLKIVYTGLLGLAQGISAICKNIDFSTLNAEFHIYGEGSEKEELLAFLNDHSDRNIYYHGSVKRKEIPATMLQYDVTLIPLVKPIYGAVPSKIYEAMAAGLPILFTGGGEGAEIVNQYNVGWVFKSSDYNAIAMGIQEVAAIDKSKLSEMKNNCREIARDVFDRNIQIDQLDSFLSSHFQ